jgi:hypothetical protein
MGYPGPSDLIPLNRSKRPRYINCVPNRSMVQIKSSAQRTRTSCSREKIYAHAPTAPPNNPYRADKKTKKTYRDRACHNRGKIYDRAHLRLELDRCSFTSQAYNLAVHLIMHIVAVAGTQSAPPAAVSPICPLCQNSVCAPPKVRDVDS